LRASIIGAVSDTSGNYFAFTGCTYLDTSARHCGLSAPLARLEAAIALLALFERYPELTLAVDPGELMPLESFVSNGYRAVPAWLT
jgi:cytochrome P450